jgi:hypothetical protein
MNSCLFVESASLTFFTAQCPNQAKAAVLADTDFRTPPDLSTASEPHCCSSTLTQCLVSDHVQPSSALHVNYNSSNRCSLPPLSSSQNSFGMSGYPGVGSLCETKAESVNSWEYSSLCLSPDMPGAGNTLFEDLGT